MPLFQLSEQLTFPPPEFSREDGLLALDGDLTVPRLILAYSMGIFPWYCPGEPILWWSPDPRLVLYPEKLVVNRSLRKTLKRGRYRVTMDRAFAEVISNCASVPRGDEDGTWIVDEMQAAYLALHREGYAHSVEAWDGDELVGGLYGVSLGRGFFGESMFSRKSDASKVCFVRLVRFLQAEGFRFVDCQVTTDHLLRFGAEEIPRSRFLRELDEALTADDLIGSWADMFYER